ncbi:DMT family transporter [Variovorax ginsengisoli]|uniref:DMT family transporter n=1 Tax=Variovorax ginsengisoli TaxID=363844 RepID=A0ABT8S029_9BURK|nr:DMT family transporter [Variovorax ginsengisoli]MDN8613104.1 DMT family transporter [Variovorax ginsengisoli]MDO1532274.1 DMT family transporter [Variovorax ginsengisoli]
MSSTLHALAAIALWATLASLGTSLSHLPPFLLTGLALVIGSAMSWPLALRDRKAWAIPPCTLALGVYGLFGFHFLLFIALRHAPPVEANLVNYLWPLFMVVLAPVLLPGMSLRPLHVLAALLGFAGAAIAILGARGGAGASGASSYWGFLPALGSAFIWASYSLWTQRVPAFPTTAIGLFGLLSGALSLACHALLEPSVALSPHDWMLVVLCGLGPLGAAFFFWDLALKRGDARQIGILSYLTPLASTALLMLVTGRALSWSIALAAVLIISAAVMGTRAR